MDAFLRQVVAKEMPFYANLITNPKQGFNAV
jgi:hypothetical protein